MDKAELIKKELERRRYLATGTIFKPYTNRDGSESWQQKCDKLLADESTNEILACLANSCGKSSYLTYLILSVLSGAHPVCKVWENEAIHLHVITQDSGIQKATIQQEMAQQSMFTIVGYSSKNLPKHLHIVRHSGIIKELINLENNNRITFSTAAEGATGTVGLAPHLIASDEPIAEDLYQEIVARNRRPKSKFLMLATPLDNKHAWVIHRACEIRDGKLKIPGVYLLQARSIDNPYFPEEKLEYWKHTFGEDSAAFRVRALGDLIVTEGLVLPGIVDCIIPNDYIPEQYREQEQYGLQPYKTYVAMDLGLYDVTLAIFVKLYPCGTIVVEDEFALYGDTLPTWCTTLHKKFNELNYPLLHQNGKLVYTDEVSGLTVRKPDRFVVDGQYVVRRNHTTGLTILHEFSQRKLFPTPSSGGKRDTKLPILQGLIKNKELLFKARCIHTTSLLQKHTFTEGKNGKVSTESVYDHAYDVLSYLLEILPPTRQIQALQQKQDLLKTNNPNSYHYDRFKKEDKGVL